MTDVDGRWADRLNWWTEERTARAVQMWVAGKSARAIARAIKAPSRSTVIGKMSRIEAVHGNMSARTARRTAQAAAAAKLQPVAATILPPAARAASTAAPPPRDPAEMEPWMCRWPTKQPGRHGFYRCCKTIQPHRKYCAEHITNEFARKLKRQNVDRLGEERVRSAMAPGCRRR